VNWYIIRHADKEKGDFYNPVLRHQDQPISAKGRAEARNLCSYFTEKSIATIYVSEYVRTRQTIEYVAQNLKLLPTVDHRLNEIDNGVIEGLTAQQISQKFPAVWKAFRERDRDFRFPEGENGEEAQQRIQSFFEEEQKNQEDILLVSHDGWIRLLVCYLLGLPVYRRWDFRVDTCGIMEIEYQPEYERWKIIGFNQKVQTK
jgi:broad specificity phosphatase PhoE